MADLRPDILKAEEDKRIIEVKLKRKRVDELFKVKGYKAKIEILKPGYFDMGDPKNIIMIVGNVKEIIPKSNVCRLDYAEQEIKTFGITSVISVNRA